MVRNRWFNYLIGGALGLLLYISLSFAIWPIIKQFLYKDNSLLYFIGINLSFSSIIISLILILKFYHQSSLKILINNTGTIQYKRITVGFIIWFSLQFFTLIFTLIFNRESLTFNFNPQNFVMFLILSLILTPIQIASEEFLFRGYLINFLKTIKKGTLFPLIVSGILFALPHLNNPEVKNDKIVFFLIYLSMALVFSYLTIKYNGLEYSLGVHFANNFFAINLVNYPDSPLPSSPIFLMNINVDPIPTLIQSLIFGILLIIIIKKIEKQ